MIPCGRAPRVALLLVLLLLLAAAVWLLFATDPGRRLRADPVGVGRESRAWVQENPAPAVAAFLAIYVVASVLCLPLWWLQVLGGLGFGLVWGVLLSMAGATIGATLTALVARWLGAEWFHEKVETRIQRLRAFEEKLDRNGLLVVLIARMIYGMPFGLTNYAMGLIGIPLIHVAVGTFLGSIPMHALVVTLAVAPAWVVTWQFITFQAM